MFFIDASESLHLTTKFDHIGMSKIFGPLSAARQFRLYTFDERPWDYIAVKIDVI